MTEEALKKLITSRQSKLETNRSQIEPIWTSVAELVNIGLGDITNRGQSDKTFGDLGRKAFDGTAIGAAVLATSGIHGYHVSPSFPWFNYVMSREVLNKVPEIKEWLQAEEADVYSALNNSNFYSAMWDFIYNGFTVGSVAIYGEEDIETGRLVFECIHPREAYFEENKFGEVDVFHRKRKRTARQLVQKFGKDNLPEAVKYAYENDPFSEFELIHAVFPREEYDDRKKDAKNKKFASAWYLTGSSKIVSEGGYDEFPYKVWRYMRSGNTVYGLSPAILALCDIKGVNIISKTMLGAAQLFLDPPLNVPSDLMGKVQWKPRGLNPYDDHNKIIRPAETGGTFPIGIDREEKIQAAIKERFHVDTFLMLANLEGRGQMTAYQVSEMMGEKAAILGAELAPLNTQMDSILDLVYFILAAKNPENGGSINPRPDALYELALEGDSFSPIYQGPLAQAQRRLLKTQGIQAAMEFAAPIIQAFPQAADNIDADELLVEGLRSFNFPQNAIKPKDRVASERQQRAEMMAQESEKQDMLDAAPAIKTAVEADNAAGGALSGAIAQNAGGLING